MVPNLARLAVLANPDAASTPVGYPPLESAAGVLEMDVLQLDMRLVDDFGLAFERAQAWHAQAVIAISSPLINVNAGHIADLALKYGLPSRRRLQVAIR
jgi:hypothetical protein